MSTSLAAQAAAAQDPETPGLPAIVQQLQAREASLKSLRMQVETRGSYPGGTELRTKGRIRVLQGTHFDFSLDSSFDGGPARGGVVSKVRGVLTPSGFWRFEEGPVAGPTYIRMSAALVAELQKAQAALDADQKSRRAALQRLPGPLDGQFQAPLGSATLKALGRFFDLRLQPGTKAHEGQVCRVLAGKWRGEGLSPAARKALEAGDDGSVRVRAAHRCEVLLRAEDLVPLRIAQFRRLPAAQDGGENASKDGIKEELALEIRIRKLELDLELARDSFVLAAPNDQVFVDALQHRPTRAQIDRVRDAYAALLERRKKNGK